MSLTYTMEEAFEKIVEGIKRQGEPSMELGMFEVKCKYRSYVGGKKCRCAAGQLLPWRRKLVTDHNETAKTFLDEHGIRITGGHKGIYMVAALVRAHDQAAKRFPGKNAEFLGAFLRDAEDVKEKFLKKGDGDVEA